MRKIPTLFVRDPDDRKHVLSIVTEGCGWVLAGEGTPTRKYDGTCVMRDEDGEWWARREVKPGKGAGGAIPARPPGFVEAEHDPITGKTVGWEPIDQSSFVKFFNEAERDHDYPGTYELCGPKINGNPEGFETHVLVAHADAEVLDVKGDYQELRAWLLDHEYEGIVWHHPDGRMAKLKRRDFS